MHGEIQLEAISLNECRYYIWGFRALARAARTYHKNFEADHKKLIMIPAHWLSVFHAFSFRFPS